MIQNYADVNAKQNDGKTALIYAAMNDNYAISNLLPQSNADVNAELNDGTTKDFFAGARAAAWILFDSSKSDEGNSIT